MTLYDLFFYLFAAITIVPAFIVVMSRNVIRSVYALFLSFFGIAGIYVLLSADFLAIVQLIVYIGGILILLLFGVMLTNKITQVPIKIGFFQIVPAILVVGLLSGVMINFILRHEWITTNTAQAGVSLSGLGIALVTEYGVLFIIFGFLLLAALVGAASTARK